MNCFIETNPLRLHFPYSSTHLIDSFASLACLKLFWILDHQLQITLICQAEYSPMSFHV